jgi:hypothetical protein
LLTPTAHAVTGVIKGAVKDQDLSKNKSKSLFCVDCVKGRAR